MPFLSTDTGGDNPVQKGLSVVVGLLMADRTQPDTRIGVIRDIAVFFAINMVRMEIAAHGIAAGHFAPPVCPDMKMLRQYSSLFNLLKFRYPILRQRSDNVYLEKSFVRSFF